MSCVLCEDIASTGDVVHEDPHATVVLHSDWSVLGHAMIVAKTHVENAADLDADEWLHFARVWQRTERVLLENTGAERAIAMKLGILTPHLHVHLYPVSAEATREDVFAAIDGRTRVPRDERFVERAKTALLTAQGD
jgi:diadenosine tetraphosphate (Ap4A) HIT family hydrolase